MQTTTSEYRIIAEGAGWFSKAGRGRLRLEGRDAIKFLHALLSNDVEHLHAGEGVYSTYLTPQGRLIADPVLYHCGDHLLMDVAPGVAPRVAARLDESLFAEQVTIADVSATLSQIAVVGADAAARLSRATGIPAGTLGALAVRAHVPQGDVRVARTDDATLPAFDVFVPAEARADLEARLAAAGVTHISADLALSLRIAAGRPAFGVDMTEETIPLEAGLQDRAISMSKGCYVGQEVIVRVLHRGGGRVAKRLVRLHLDERVHVPPKAGAAVAADGADVGRVTSAAVSPDGARVIALGYVHRDAAEVGRHVTIDGADAEIVGMAG